MEDFRWFRTQRLVRLYLWTELGWEQFQHELSNLWYGGDDE